jgi:hypothetical protein
MCAAADVSGDIEAVRRLMDIVVALNISPSTFDLLGFPEWFPRREPKAY